jgi:hypothetical protein
MDRHRSTPARRPAVGVLALGTCALALACPLGPAAAAGAQRAGGQHAGGQPGPSQPPDSATLVECVTSVVQTERAAIFAGEMTAVAGTTRMTMRVDVQERVPGGALFHTISAPGLGVWRSSDPKVKVYKYLKEVTNLSAPASYRALVRFRWMNGRGHVIKHDERFTARCVEPVAPAVAPPAQGSPGAPSSSSPSSSASSSSPASA